MKQLFLDTETSGISSYHNGVWQISAISLFNGKEQGRFNQMMKILDNQRWDNEAQQMLDERGYIYNDFQSCSEGFLKFKIFLESYINPFDRLDKALLYGYNVDFDEKFIRSFFLNNQNKFYGSWFHSPSIDVMSLAAEYLKDIRHNMPNFKLGTVARTLGIEIDESRLHDAMYDTELTYQIYQIITHEQKSK